MPADLIQESSSPKSIPLGFTKRTNANGEEFFVPQVDAGNIGSGSGDGGTSGPGIDKEIHVTTYRVKNAFPGATVGQMVSAIRAFDVSPNTILQVGPTFWLNETTGSAITPAPALSDLEQPQIVSGGLTNAEFVAGMAAIAKEAKQPALTAGGRVPVEVAGTLAISAEALPLAPGAATADKQGALKAGRALVDGSEVTQPISAQSLPLPAGAATEGTAIAIGQVLMDIRAGVASDASIGALGVLLGTLNNKVSTAAAQAQILAAIEALSAKTATAANQTANGATAATAAAQALILTAVNELSAKTATAANQTSMATAAATGAKQDIQQTALDAIRTAAQALILQLPASRGPKPAADSLAVTFATDAALPTNTLAQPGAAKRIPVVAAGGAHATVDLVATTRRVSIVAVSTSIRYAVGTTTAPVNASNLMHLIMAGERLDIAVPANCRLSALSDTSSAGTLEISELI